MHPEPSGSFNSVDMVIVSTRGHLSYHQWWSMGATLIIDVLELAPVLSGSHLLILERWNAELV